jgi:Tfp pilus assembly protein PilF
VAEYDIWPAYVDRVLSFAEVPALKPLKVVIDAANGMAGTMLPPVLERLPIDAVRCYFEPDGSFPNHEPNPLLPENREFIVRKTLEEGADLGVAFDGDADRCFFVDDTGRFVDGDFLTAILAVLVVTVVLVLARRRWPGGLAVGFAYALALAPVSGLIHAGPQLVADRFSYLPSLGLCLLPGAGVAVALAKPALGRAVVAGAAVWIMALAMLTWSQVQVWSDTDTLFAYTLQIAPDCAWCQHQYGGSLGNRGQLEPAITHFERAVALLPDRVVYHHHLGLALLKAGRPGEALSHLEQTVAAQPWNVDAAMQLGLALVALDRPTEALPYLERASTARPEAADARLGLARAYRALGRGADAEAQLLVLRRLDPAMAARVDRP